MGGIRWYRAVLTIVLPIHFVVWEVQSLSLVPDTKCYWSPSCVTLQGVSQSYPDSFWRKLTSSVPRRTYALENASLVFDPGMSLLLGESSSGKSTILRLVLGSERPSSGTVVLSNNAADATVVASARPVCLDTRPSYGQNEVVEDIWNKAIPPSRCSSSGGLLVADLSKLLKLPLHSKILELSMSEVYLCRIGEACLQSMLLGIDDDRDRRRKKNDMEEEEEESSSPTTVTTNPEEESVRLLLLVPAPILLLDEWLDTETSVVVQKVQSSLNELARNGAVIVCVTHKPHLFSRNTNQEQDNEVVRRIVTLSRGKVVSTIITTTTTT
jgi:energy-coupling factor transporter ATP-binding protein EcfA2